MAFDRRESRAQIVVLEGLQAVRQRPAMFLGEPTPGRTLATSLLGLVLGAISEDTPRPSAVRVRLHSDGVLVAYDGAPLPIEPTTTPRRPTHPLLYRFFMELMIGPSPYGRSWSFGAILNAFTERLVVSTMDGGERYRAVFSRGTLVTLLAPVPCRRPEGTAWLEYAADPELITGPALDATQARVVCDEVHARTPSLSITFEDRSAEEMDRR